MNPVEWLLYAAACDLWAQYGGFVRIPEYDSIREIIREGNMRRETVDFKITRFRS